MRDQEQRAERLREAAQKAAPGLTFEGLPQPFGWAPTRHMRARVSGSELQSVVLRQSWSTETHETECRLYRSLLGHLPVRTAALVGVFELDDDEPAWMILEDLGTDHLRADSHDHRRRLLKALGMLHGTGRELGLADGSVVSVFRPSDGEQADWTELLASGNRDLGIEDWMAGFAENTLGQLEAGSYTLLHGDIDFSNFVVAGGEVAFLDWEKANWGPPGLDIGPLMEYVREDEELEAYVEGWEGVGGGLPIAARQWARLGEIYDCVRWICYYLRAKRNGADPGPEWKAQYYDPRTRRLSLLRDQT